MQQLEKLSFLRQVDLFKELVAEELLLISEQLKLKDMAKGELIFAKGDLADSMYFVVSGTVAIEDAGNILSTLNLHDYFGELAILDSSPRGADARASSDGLLLVLYQDDLTKLLEDVPAVMRAILNKVMGYLRTYYSAEKE